MNLRPTTDVRLILRLDEEIFDGDEPADVWDPSVKWWALGDLAFCGAKTLSCGTAAFLIRAGVVERARGQGLQRRMIQTRCRWARSQGLESVITYTVPTNVHSSNNLIRGGFRLYEPQVRWSGEDLNYWLKKLT